MAYINDGNPHQSYASLPGSTEPVVYNGWSRGNTEFFGQEMAVEGNLRTTSYQINRNTMGFPTFQGFGNNPGNYYGDTINLNPPATNFFIEEGTGGANTQFSTVAIGQDSSSILRIDEAADAAVRTDYLVDVNQSNLEGLITSLAGSGSNKYTGFSADFGTSQSADSPTDDIDFEGDFQSQDAANSYIKTEAAANDKLKITFERRLFERIEGDEGGTLRSTDKDCIVKFTGGDGVVTEVIPPPSGSSKTFQVVIKNRNAPVLARIEEVLGSSFGAENAGSGSPASIAGYRYRAKIINFQVGQSNEKQFTLSAQDYLLVDFSIVEPNEPILNANVPATLDFQRLNEGSIVMAYQISAGGPFLIDLDGDGTLSPVLVMSGLGKFGSTCDQG